MLRRFSAGTPRLCGVWHSAAAFVGARFSASHLRIVLRNLRPCRALSFRAQQADLFFVHRSCDALGLRSRGISLRSFSVASVLILVSFLSPVPPHQSLIFEHS